MTRGSWEGASTPPLYRLALAFLQSLLATSVKFLQVREPYNLGTRQAESGAKVVNMVYLGALPQRNREAIAGGARPHAQHGDDDLRHPLDLTVGPEHDIEGPGRKPADSRR